MHLRGLQAETKLCEAQSEGTVRGDSNECVIISGVIIQSYL